MGKILIGTSGWMYKSWGGEFYPDSLPAKEELEYYAHEFPTVEVNSSFYRLPEPHTYTAWAKQVPGDFLFSVKASRFLTHMKKLKDPADPWDRVIKRARKLKSKLGPILLQFPQQWTENYNRLEEFLSVAKRKRGKTARLVFEFRNDSWFIPEVYRLLEKYDAALCIADSYKFNRYNDATTDFAYIRYHGRKAKDPKYTKKELEKEAKLISKLSREIDVFVYFNNDARGYAIQNARTLVEMLS